MTRCDNCGSETTLPFTCQHCGGKFCADCRLPPNHNCTGIVSWNQKPRPGVGMSYSKGGGIAATGGVVRESSKKTRKNETRIPWLWIMLTIIGLVLLGIVWLVLTGQGR